jgi:hypothetical protein
MTLSYASDDLLFIFACHIVYQQHKSCNILDRKLICCDVEYDTNLDAHQQSCVYRLAKEYLKSQKKQTNEPDESMLSEAKIIPLNLKR